MAFGRGGQETVRSIMARETANPNRQPSAPTPRPLMRANRSRLKQNPSSRIGATSTPHVQTASQPASPPQTPSTQFLAAQVSDSGNVPPDTMGAVGPTQLVVFVNGRIRSFNKSTGAVDGILNASTDTFFPTLVRNGQVTTDPRIRYDRLSARWFLTMVSFPTSTPTDNRILLAWSNTGAITGATVFSFAWIDMAAVHPNGCVIDYDTLGVDANAVYVGGNIFCGADFASLQLLESDGFVIPKAGLLAGSPAVTAFKLAGDGSSPSCPAPGAGADGVFTPQGVDNYDPNAGVGFFVGVSVCFLGELVFARITNPGSNSPGAQLIVLTVPRTATPAAVPTLGSTNPLDGLDDRLLAAHLRNGHLWTAHNICVDSTGAAPLGGCAAGSRDAERWYDVKGLDGSPVLNQSGTVFDSSVTSPLNYWMGSIMVSGQGHVAMGSSVASAGVHAQAAFTGRLSNDGPGIMMSPAIYQASTFDYNRQSTPVQRWGDFSYTSLDPSDDMTMWTIQEFTNATNSWGVEAVKLLAPPPATPTAATANATAGQCNETINVSATSAAGSGFFEPGAGFTNHIQAAISGGVTVNHIAVVDPTNLVLDVSTEGAAAGPKNLTVTNPDGQTVTVNGLIFVQASSTQPAAGTALSTSQYTLSNSDGTTWQYVDSSNLKLTCAPSANHTTLLTANADLFTATAGYNQDIGIFASDNGGADTLVSWKESGGFAGTFSPNAAYVQGTYNMVAGHTYVFKLKWKTNRNAPGSTIFAGAGAAYPFSPTSLVAETFATGVVPNFAVSTGQYTLSNSDGSTWQVIDDTDLSTALSPGANATAVLGANVDLFTATAGYNQDIGIFVSDNGGSDTLVAWKESGGFAGTFSPNAAFVKATYPMTSGHTYRFRLKWKTNKNAPGVTIFAAAGAGPTLFSQTSLLAETIGTGANPYTAVSTSQYTLSNSDGATWQDMNPPLQVTVSPGSDTNSIVGVNVDLFTATAGYNQDIAIFVSNNGGPDTLVVWKESGGSAGIFSPNAAFAQITFQMTGGHTYIFKVKWKTNRNAPGTTIFAAAGGGAPFSHTRLIAELTS